MAVTSACAVGSFVDVTRFQPRAMIRPRRTTTDNGPPQSARIFVNDNRMAARMNSSCMPPSLAGKRRQEKKMPRQPRKSHVIIASGPGRRGLGCGRAFFQLGLGFPHKNMSQCLTKHRTIVPNDFIGKQGVFLLAPRRYYE